MSGVETKDLRNQSHERWVRFWKFFGFPHYRLEGKSHCCGVCTFFQGPLTEEEKKAKAEFEALKVTEFVHEPSHCEYFLSTFSAAIDSKHLYITIAYRVLAQPECRPQFVAGCRNEEEGHSGSKNSNQASNGVSVLFESLWYCLQSYNAQPNDFMLFVKLCDELGGTNSKAFHFLNSLMVECKVEEEKRSTNSMLQIHNQWRSIMRSAKLKEQREDIDWLSKKHVHQVRLLFFSFLSFWKITFHFTGSLSMCLSILQCVCQTAQSTENNIEAGGCNVFSPHKFLSPAGGGERPCHRIVPDADGRIWSSISRCSDQASNNAWYLDWSPSLGNHGIAIQSSNAVFPPSSRW